MSKFTKGDSRINTAGRPKGSANVLTKELRSALKDVMHDEIKAIPTYLNKLDDKERLDAVIKLASFVLPKVSSVNHEAGEPLSFNSDTW